MSIPSEHQSSIDRLRVRRMISAAERPVIIADGI